MGEYLSESRLRQFVALFVSYDSECTNRIGIEAVHEILKSMTLKVSIDEMYELVRETSPIDPTCLTVTLTEFLAIISLVIEDKIINKEIYGLFEIFDVDKNKVIDQTDFQLGFKHLETNLSEEEILKLIHSSQKNNLTLREFRKLILDK